MVYSSNSNAASKRIVQLSPLLIIPFLLYIANLKIDKKARSNILAVFVGGNIVYTMIIIVTFFSNMENLYYENLGQYLFDYDKFQYDLSKSVKNNIVFMHKPYFSMGFVLSAVFCLQLFFHNTFKKRITRFLYLSVFGYFTLWVFYAFSFPNVLALFICIFLILYKSLNRKVFLASATLFLIFCTSLLIFKFQDKDVQRGVNFLKSSVDDLKYELNDSRREIYKTYQEIAQKSSWNAMLFGFGVGDVQDKLNVQYVDRLNRNKSKNLLFFTEELNQSYWYKNNIEVVPNQEESPKNEKGADLLIAGKVSEKLAYNISHKIDVQKEELYTFSIFAKKKEGPNTLILRLGEIDNRAVFNIEEGTLIEKMNVSEAGIQQLENNWYRCFISVSLKQDGLILLGLSNSKADYVFANTDEVSKSLYAWGIQLEKGNLTQYEENEKDQIQMIVDQKLNTHNNYLYFLIATGVFGLISFLIFIGYLFKQSIKPYNILRISFCLIISINFLTENILSRHWGLMFIAFMLTILFSEEKNKRKV